LKFDENGDETEFDFKRCLGISKEAGFKGVYSGEFGGPGEPYEGTQKILDERVKYL
jgi:hypothetical protein